MRSWKTGSGAGTVGRRTGARSARVLGLLGAEQKARWHELAGEPFAGVLPPGDLILSLGKMTFQIAPQSAAREPRRDPPTSPGRAK